MTATDETKKFVQIVTQDAILESWKQLDRVLGEFKEKLGGELRQAIKTDVLSKMGEVTSKYKPKADGKVPDGFEKDEKVVGRFHTYERPAISSIHELTNYLSVVSGGAVSTRMSRNPLPDDIVAIALWHMQLMSGWYWKPRGDLQTIETFIGEFGMVSQGDNYYSCPPLSEFVRFLTTLVEKYWNLSPRCSEIKSDNDRLRAENELLAKRCASMTLEHDRFLSETGQKDFAIAMRRLTADRATFEDDRAKFMSESGRAEFAKKMTMLNARLAALELREQAVAAREKAVGVD